MKKRLTIFTVLAGFLLTAPAHAADFTDADRIAHWEAVSVLTDRGILGGRPDGSFDPEGTTRRAEIAKILSLLADPDPENVPSAGFTDTHGTWAERYIDHCYSLGLAAGRGGGTFDPNGAVTGTETAKMLLVLAGYDPAPFSGSGWAEHVNAAAEASGLYEDFTASPDAPLSRDNMALLLYNFLTIQEQTVIDFPGDPTGIAVMPDGSLLVTDTFSRTVFLLRGEELRVYAGAVPAADANGQPVGGYYDASAEDSLFRLPWAAAPFLDGWAVSDAENNAVRLIRDGQVMSVNPGGQQSRIFSYPTGLAAAADGSLYVADTHNGLIRRIRTDGTITTEASGLRDPMGLCWQDGVLYIAETGANRIVQLKNGKISAVAGSGRDGYEDGPAASAQFSGPKAVIADENGQLYVSDTGNGAVRLIADGSVTTVMMRDPANGETLFPVSPVGLALEDGRLYICDTFAKALLILPTDG
ncbi:MAG: S-layer homology domain-containing protein [Oscillospiraceae bacterium]|nr:S-layer homology domain-containing protein [Oscillospiraceae bacterium]